MEKFISKHSEKISGILSSFDRVVFKGYLPFRYPEAMESFLSHNKILVKNFSNFCKTQSQILKKHGQEVARRQNRPYIYYAGSKIRKDDYARNIAKQDNISEGLICIIATVEQSPSFRMCYGENRPRLKSCRPKCLTLYYYFFDPICGFMHIRIQTWFPFMIQICLNGHEWLARRLDEKGIEYQKEANAFTFISDYKKAQKLANNFQKVKFNKRFDQFAGRVNPLLPKLLKGMSYYWVTDQAEFSTDVIFKTKADLKLLYQKLGHHAIIFFDAQDVMGFFDKKLHGNFKSELTSDFKKRFMVTRVKHKMSGNWIKMYDKHGIMVRVETVINQPYKFKIRREGIRKGIKTMGWYPMAKRVSNLFRYKEVCLMANCNYLNALSVIDDPKENVKLIEQVCRSAKIKNVRRRALNLLSTKDYRLCKAIMRGENFIRGFRHIEFAQRIGVNFSKDYYERKRQSARVSRLLHLLRAHRLISKIPRTRLYRVTQLGVKIMSAVINMMEIQPIDFSSNTF